jgi:hypothetical protein
MKKILMLLSILTLALACGSSKEKYREDRAEAKKEYKEQLKQAEEEYKEEEVEDKKDEAEEIVEESDDLEINDDNIKVE